jgi:hypothetical protein
MKKLIIKLIFALILMAAFGACKKEAYPEELQFIVIDSFTRKPISNATVYLYKVWRHPVKIGNHANEADWFPEYGRKHMTEYQEGNTNEDGIVTFSQNHKQYLYILPAVYAQGYQRPSLDTLSKMGSKKIKGTYYTLALNSLIKTTFVIKSHTQGFEKDSVVFSSNDKVMVYHGKGIDEKFEVFTSNPYSPYSNVWYTASIYRNGKKGVLCNSVKSYPNQENTFEINVDL